MNPKTRLSFDLSRELVPRKRWEWYGRNQGVRAVRERAMFIRSAELRPPPATQARPDRSRRPS
jgi:hypothetical protein